jgi:hypothetical protein
LIRRQGLTILEGSRRVSKKHFPEFLSPTMTGRE